PGSGRARGGRRTRAARDASWPQEHPPTHTMELAAGSTDTLNGSRSHAFALIPSSVMALTDGSAAIGFGGEHAVVTPTSLPLRSGARVRPPVNHGGRHSTLDH